MKWLNVAGGDLFDQTVLPVKHLTVVRHTVGGCLTVNQDFIIEKICLCQGFFAMGGKTADFAVGDFAGGYVATMPLQSPI